MKRSIGKAVTLLLLLMICAGLVVSGYFSDQKEQKELLVLQKKYEQKDKNVRKIRDQLYQKRSEWTEIKVVSGYFSDQKEQKELLVLQKKYEQKDKNVRKIRDQLYQKRSEWTEINPKGFVILAFSEENQQLKESIKPELEKRGLTATLVLKTKENIEREKMEAWMDELVLKTKENIEREKMEAWMDEGWDLAFGGEIGNQKEQREQFLNSFRNISEECKRYGEDAPQVEAWMDEGWDLAFGGEIGNQKEQREQFLNSFRNISEECKRYGEDAPQGFFFNGGDFSYGKPLLYPEMSQHSYSMAVMFAQNENLLHYSVNQQYGEIKECQNVSLRRGYEVIEAFVEQAKAEEVPVVLSDFGAENQMEISGEENIEDLTKILDFIQQKKENGDLLAGSIKEYMAYVSRMEEEKKKVKEEYLIYEQENEKQRKEIYEAAQ